MRLTGQRRVIWQVLGEFGDATGQPRPDPVAIHRRAVLRDPRITLASVCRTIQWLEDVRGAEATSGAPGAGTPA
ncbi:hypothetical protein [Azospirillum halopraeferens]|uniref:hypothetical protein n=1 Tax=Azospirillum halopraeferens TaxID=34010 RepID=UPI0006889205|nr:hypothetical protein [Azospirillum halopraeferens]